MTFIIEQGFNSLLTFIIGILIVNVSGLGSYGQFSVYILSSLLGLNFFYNLVTAPCLIEDNYAKRMSHFCASIISTLPIVFLFSTIIFLLGFWDVYALLPLYVAIFCFDDCARKIIIKDKAMFLLSFRYIAIFSSLISYYYLDHSGVISYLYFYFLSSILFLIVSLYFLKVRLEKSGLFLSFKVYKSNYGILVTSLFQWGATNSINAIAYGVLSSTHIGAIKSAQNIASVANFTIISMESYLLSVLQSGKGNFESELFRRGSYMVVVISMLTLFLFVFREEIVNLVYLDSHGLISSAFTFLLFLPLGSLLNLLLKVHSRLSDNVKPLLLSSLIASIVSIVYYCTLTNAVEVESLPKALLFASYTTVFVWFFLNINKVKMI